MADRLTQLTSGKVQGRGEEKRKGEGEKKEGKKGGGEERLDTNGHKRKREEIRGQTMKKASETRCYQRQKGNITGLHKNTFCSKVGG